MGRLIIATLLLLLIAGCSGGSAPPVQDIDPGPVDPGPALVDPGPAIGVIQGGMTADRHGQWPLLPDYGRYVVGLRRESDDQLIGTRTLDAQSFLSSATFTFEWTGLYLGSYRVQLLDFDPRQAVVHLNTVWSSKSIALSSATPTAYSLQFDEEVQFQSCLLVYDLYLTGSPPPEAIQADIFFGCKRIGESDTKLVTFWNGAWDAVLSSTEGPWDNYHLDFNNDGVTPETYHGFPPADYIIGVYRIDPAKPKELIVYGESTEAFTAVPETPAAGVAISIDYQHPAIRQLP